MTQRNFAEGTPDWDPVRIYELRKHLQLSQREFAARLGTSQQRISEWETGFHRAGKFARQLLSQLAQETHFTS